LIEDLSQVYEHMNWVTGGQLYEAYSESKGRLVSKKNIFVRHIFY